MLTRAALVAFLAGAIDTPLSSAQLEDAVGQAGWTRSPRDLRDVEERLRRSSLGGEPCTPTHVQVEAVLDAARVSRLGRFVRVSFGSRPAADVAIDVASLR